MHAKPDESQQPSGSAALRAFRNGVETVRYEGSADNLAIDAHDERQLAQTGWSQRAGACRCSTRNLDRWNAGYLILTLPLPSTCEYSNS